MFILDEDTISEFMERFGNCYDCVINSFYINNNNLEIKIEVEDCNINDIDKRRMLVITVDNLVEYKIAQPKNIDIYVLYNGINVYFTDSLIYLDLQSESIDASFEEIKESLIYFAGESVKWKIMDL
jgi:hypothetical protein